MLADERAQPVDLAHLARYTGGDIALNGEILRLFQIQTRDLIAQLYDSLEAGNTKAWRDVTHSIKGAARGIGAFSLADAVADAEKFQPREDRCKAQAALATVKSRVGLVSLFIDSYLR
jgi:HPt (histidine-containing phosphotransfer) domain-containing protein